MRLRTVTIVLAILSAVLAGAAAQPTSPPRDARASGSYGTATIRGRVVDAATGHGIPRVALELNGGQPSGSAGDMTDEDGAFSFTGLPPGLYSISATKAAYETARLPEPRPGRWPKRLEVAAGGTLENVTIAMARSSAITGRVVDEFGEPVERAEVRIRPAPGARRRYSGTWMAQTNDIGEFRLAPVEPGRYILTAHLRTHVFPSRGSRPRTGFVAWPQVPSLDQADALVVERGQDVRDLELKLYPTTTSRVTGVVLGADGAPLANAWLRVSLLNEGEEDATGGTGSEARNGRFELTLDPGTYDLTAGTRPAGPTSPPWGGSGVATTRLTVTGEPIEGLTLQIAAPKPVRGRVVFATGGSIPAPDPSAIRVGARGDGCPHDAVAVAPDLTFTMLIGHDRCRINASADRGWRLRSMMQGDRDLMFAPVVGAARERPDEIVLTFTDRTTRLSALVTNAKGQAADAFLVLAFSADKVRRPSERSRAYNYAVAREAGPSRAGGPASLDGLLPGDYFVLAVDPDEYDVNGVPDYDALELLAQRISLVEGQPQALTLRIQQLPGVR